MGGHKPFLPRGLALPEEEAMELCLRVMVQLIRIVVLAGRKLKLEEILMEQDGDGA